MCVYMRDELTRRRVEIPMRHIEHRAQELSNSNTRNKSTTYYFSLYVDFNVQFARYGRRVSKQYSISILYSAVATTTKRQREIVYSISISLSLSEYIIIGYVVRKYTYRELRVHRQMMTRTRM